MYNEPEPEKVIFARNAVSQRADIKNRSNCNGAYRFVEVQVNNSSNKVLFADDNKMQKEEYNPAGFGIYLPADLASEGNHSFEEFAHHENS